MNRRYVCFVLALAGMVCRAGGVDAQGIAAPATPLIYRVENSPGKVAAPVLLGDRHVYLADDRDGQFYLSRPAVVATSEVASAETLAETSEPASTNLLPLAADLHLALVSVDGDKTNGIPVAEAVVPLPLFAKTHFLVRTLALKPGRYKVLAVLRDERKAALTEPLAWTFVRSDQARKPLAFPAEGVPVELETQAILPSLDQPFHASIPLPLNAVDDTGLLRLEEDGRPVPSQIRPVATWGPAGSVRWAHLQFIGRYRDGRAAQYRLLQGATPVVVPAGPATVKVDETPRQITVDNGTVRFVVNRQRFSGIEQAWFDPTGSGRYDPASPLVVTNRQMTGPYLVDGRMIRFEASADKEVKVEIEERGPVKVTIAATGWYTEPRKNGGRLCQFKTRITCHAGQPAIRVSHHTIISFDTRMAMLKDVGFPIPVAAAQRYRLGADQEEKAGALPAIPANPVPDRDGITDIPSVYLHQDRSDHFRLMQGGTALGEGRRSDGWASVLVTNRAEEVGVVLRDIWQKFPKEIEMSAQGLTLHFWPAHGRRSFTLEEELSRKNLHKFWCFHQHSLLNLTLPPDYFQALTEAWEETAREHTPAHALNGNGEGLAIGNAFEIRFMAGAAPATAAAHPGNLAAIAALIQMDPAARTPSGWNAGTEALDRLAAVDPAFQTVEDSFEKGMMSYNASVERGENYGMWIWPDTHTYWKVDENRPSLHRVWQNSHYHQVGNSWQMWFRSGSPALLRWARTASDHYRNVSTINYTELDENGRSPLKFHRPGAMYHCKGCTPWGSEAEGMSRHDTHAGLWGHWTDPDAHLWAWLMDADPRAHDLYDLWLDSAKRWGLLSKGSRREANNTLAMACTAYEATWDADLLPVIHGLGYSLRTKEPLEKQFPGPLWHPLWINRYYHLTRDPDYIPFILKYARYTSLGDTWTLGLSALAYELSGDATYLTQHMSSLRNLPRTMYHEAGAPYDWYGKGPGPLGFRWGEMTWGQFLRALQEAKITGITPPVEFAAGSAPLELGRRTSFSVVYALERTDAPWTLKFLGAGVEGDFVKSKFKVTAPDGTVLDERVVLQANAPRFVKEMAADGKTGLYRLEVNGYGVFNQNATTLDAHASILKTNATYLVPATRGFLAPLGKPAPLEIRTSAIGKGGDRMIANVMIWDATGKELGQASLCRFFNNKSATFRVDPAVNPLPWRFDVMGACSIALVSDTGRWILAPSPQDVEAMKGLLENIDP